MNEREIINTYDQLRAAVAAGLIPKEKAVAISYYANPSGRAGYGGFNKSLVWSPFFAADTGAHWSNQGRKAFAGRRTDSFPKAKAWASEQYGITDWKPNRMRDHVPAEVQKAFPIPKRD